MFEKFFKDLIVHVLGNYIEDFTEDAIEIDNWNGVVVKESCLVKPTALQSLMRSAVGAPVTVKTGFVRKIRAVVPWSEILSKPVEIYLDDIHVICDSPAGFDREFMRKTEHKSKKAEFEELLKSFKAQQAKAKDAEAGEDKQASKEEEREQQDSYLSRLKKIVLENLRVSINNIHLRFEDTSISRAEKAFNFALTIDQVVYSSTNNRFERVFLNIDDKKNEKRSFAMLEIKQLALYWNTNAHENWTQNREFVNLDCLKTIDFSKKYIENLKRKYHQYQQNFTQNQVYVIQPLDFSIKFRWNLNQKAQPTLPLSTQNYEISQLLVTLDEEIYKDMQYLMKFWSWHSTAVKKEMYHFKFRPAYNESVKGNARKYWQYAIKSTIYYLKRAKAKKSGQLRNKRQRQMVQLSELYKLKAFNKWIKDNYSSNIHKDHMVFKVQLQQYDQNEANWRTVTTELKDMEEVAEKIYRLEAKLTPEQMVVAFTKAEKEAEDMIAEEKQRAGWTSWLSSSVMNIIGYGNSQETSEGSEKDELLKQEKELENLMKKVQEFENSETSSMANQDMHTHTATKKEYKLLEGHKTLNIPVIQLSLVNKSMHQYGSKQFMMVVIQDLFLQVLSANNYSSILWSIKNFEIVDRLLNQQKFSRMIQKKEQQDRLSQKLQTHNLRIQYQKQKMYNPEESLSEIEEEMNPNINNGMQQIQEYDRLKGSLEMNQSYFLVMQFIKNSQKRQDPVTKELTLVKCYNIDLMITNIQIFYNRVLLSRAESFINQARINKVQNASAEADFDNKIEKLRQQTEKRVSNMLEKSEIQVNCNLRSMELLAPDNINYEMSKFLILQTGDIHVRSGESKRLNLYFSQNSVIERQIQRQFRQKISANLKANAATSETFEQSIEMNDPAQDTDKYSFMIYDFKILYIPTVDQLENYMYNDTFQADIDLKHSILKKMDIIMEYHTGAVVVKSEPREASSLAASEQISSFNHIKVGIGSVDIRLTNKEIQQLKDFQDNIVKYHDQISYEINRELKQIQKFNFGREIKEQRDHGGAERFSQLQSEEDGLIFSTQIDEASGGGAQIMAEAISRMSSLQKRSKGNKLNESFKSIGDIENQSVPEDEEDEFQDAQDYFDPEMIGQIGKLRETQENVIEMSDTGEDGVEAGQRSKEFKKKDKNIMISLCMPRVQLSILEASDFEKELVRGIREKIGASFTRNDQQLIDLDLKVKGLPFLEFELSKINLRLYQYSEDQVIGFFIKEISLVNVEKRRDPRKILISSNHDIQYDSSNIKKSFDEHDQHLSGLKKNAHKSLILGPEDEDQIPAGNDYIQDDVDINAEDEIDQFLEMFIVASLACKRISINVGQTEIEFNDTLIRKVYESIFQDMPESSISKYKELHTKSQQPIPAKSNQQQTVEFKWLGLNAILRDKKDYLLLKLLNLKFSLDDRPQEQTKSMNMSLRDFQVVQDEYEILLKHHGSSMQSPRNFQTRNDVDMDENVCSDLDDESTFETSLIKFNQHSDSLSHRISRSLLISDLLFIVDLKSLLKIVMIQKSYENQIANIKQSRQKKRPTKKSEDIEQPTESEYHESVLQIQVKESYLQFPAREGKNSLFLVFEDFSAMQTKAGETGDKDLQLDDKLIQLYVGQQFDQTIRYNLLSIRNTSVQGLNGSHNVSVQDIAITLNENYILLLSKLIDENFDDGSQLMAKLRNKEDDHVGKPKENETTKNDGSSQIEQINQASKPFYFERLFKNDLESIQEIMDLNNFELDGNSQVRIENARIFNFLIDSFKIEWIFGQTFDEHQDQFVTLNNRNFTRLILDKFDNEAAGQTEVKSENGGDDQIEGSLNNFHKVSSFFRKKENSYNTLIPQASSPTKQKHQTMTTEFKGVTIQQMNTIVDSEGQSRKSNSRILKVADCSIKYVNQNHRHFLIMAIRKMAEQQSIELLIGTDVITKIGLCDIQICQQNAQMISSLTKSIYSCKNVVYKGRRRMFLAKMFSSSNGSGQGEKEGKGPLVVDEAGINKLTRIEVVNVRVILFDSTNMEKEKSVSNSRSGLFTQPNYKRSSTFMNNMDDHDIKDDLIDDVIKEENDLEDNGQDKRGSSLLSPARQAENDMAMIESEHQKFFKDQFQQKIASEDSIAARSAYLVNVSISAAITRSPKWILEQYDQDVFDLGLNKLSMLKFKNLEVYQNNFATTLSELTEFKEHDVGLSKQEFKQYSLNKQIILHPTNILLRQADYVQEADFPCKQQQDVDISTTEIEISLKQIFKLKLLGEKIDDRLQPIKQILEHVKRKNQRTQREFDKKMLSQKPQFTGNTKDDHSSIKDKQSFIRLSQFYFTMIKEIGESSMIGLNSNQKDRDDYLSSQFAPIVSIESKNIKVISQKQSDGLVDLMKVSIPLESYYFNQNLNFFEPFIERTQIDVAIEKTIQNTQSEVTKIEIKDLLNLNFSVALYDSLFNFMSNLKQEKLIYEQTKQSYQQTQQQSQSQSGQQSSSNPSKKKKTNAGAGGQQSSDPLYSASSYFIKNSTGEILMFKTLNQKAFQEIQPDEEYPIDFQIQSMAHTSDSPTKEGQKLEKVAENQADLKQSIDTIRKMKKKSKKRKMKNNRDILNEINQSSLIDNENADITLREISFGSGLESSGESQYSYSDSEEQMDEDGSLGGDDQVDDQSQSEISDTDEEADLGISRESGDFVKQQRHRKSSKNEQGKQKDPIQGFKINFQPSRSIFRRRNYKFLKSEPKKVYFQIVVQQGSDMERTPVFEVNIDIQACQRIFLDDQKEFYVICQTQQADGKKHLIVRSPMQICNNLQIPLEMILSNQGNQGLMSQKSSQTSLSEMTDEEVAKHGIIKSEYTLLGHAMQYEMLVKPEQSIVIPLRACGFKYIQLRPLHNVKKLTSTGALNRDNKKFEWTQKSEISLLKDEAEIFEQKPIILESKMLRKNTTSRRPLTPEQLEAMCDYHKIFMVLNANTYSIRSYVDFNTQQTEFISMRYLSISSPFIFQNLIPAPISLFFKNISRKINNQSLKKQHKGQYKEEKEFKDPQLYDLDIKHNSQLQILFLNPLGNFDLSLVIPGFEQTDFVAFKANNDEDMKICQDIKRSNYVKSMFSETENHELEHSDEEEKQTTAFAQKQDKNLFNSAQFRFIKQKKMLFQLVSQFQNQFNICANIAFVQGQYHMTFYSKYWLLNNTLMPLEVQIKTKTYKFEKMNLPFENQDFDFETIKRFEEPEGKQNEKGEKNGSGKPKRKNSNDTIITQTVAAGEDYRSTRKGSINDAASMRSNPKHGYCEEQVNYKLLTSQQRSQTNSKTQFNRIKPWEGYKFQEQDNLGLLGLLDQQDIDSIQTVYFTQEEYKDENKSERTGSNTDGQIQEIQNEKLSQANSQREQRVMQALKRSSANLLAVDQQTLMSKTSIQMVQFQDQLDSQEAVPLIHTELSNVELYSAPLKDQSQLKRIVLFSDNPQDENELYQIHKEQRKQNREQTQSQQQIIESISQSIQDDIKCISIKICDSDWTELPFDETKLQGESILLKDKLRKFCTNSMYEIVANVQYLPNPFSFSKIIEFKPRYMMVNKTYQTIQIIQAECEEKGVLKAYPFETSVFHWTDSTKPQEINVKFSEHEYSGNIRIDGIGEINLRLRGSFDNESIILSVSITEERNTLFIIFNDVSYAPPYRIENLTKTSFKIQQVCSRTNDFDILRPYQIIPYAWSYPLNEKLLKISISSASTDTDLGSFKIDQINKSEKIMLQDKKSERQFLLEILNEKTLKVIRISYTDEFTQNELINNLQDNEKVANQYNSKAQIILRQFGISVINSQARELAYLFTKNFKFSLEKQMNNIEFSVQADDFQIDNQLVRKSDEIIIKRDPDIDSQDSALAAEHFLHLKVQYMKNEAIENLYFFRYFYLMVIPFNLNLDGNFCDEMFRYGSDIIQQTKKYQTQDKNKLQEFYDKDINDIDKIKKAFDDLKKPYDQPGREVQVQKKIYFEEFYIHDIKMRFTFNSSPIMFREFTMNPTLKFLIVLMSNLKNVKLKFGSFQIQQQQQLMTIFFAQLKRHYLYQCYNHQQILKLISSMGLFGNISESLSSLSNAIESLVYHPFHEDTFLKGVAIGGAIFVKQSISAITGPVQSIFESFKSGMTFLFQYGVHHGKDSTDEQELRSLQDRNMFDDDIEQVSKDFNNFGTPLNAIDTQNRIWLKIITKERSSQDIKRQFLKKQPMKMINDQSFEGSQAQQARIDGNGQEADQSRAGLNNDQELDRTAQHTLTNFYKRQNIENEGSLTQLTRSAWGKLIYIPRRLLTSSAQVIDDMNTRLIEERLKLQVQKSRPPRFTSFTMQLEPYSLKKALALEILNDINLNMLQTETIHKLYTMDKYVIIFTAKRIICVQELQAGAGRASARMGNSRALNLASFKRGQAADSRLHDQDEEEGSTKGAGEANGIAWTSSSKALIFQRSGNSAYKHWNINFDDILKLRLEIVVQRGMDLTTGELLFTKLSKEEQQSFGCDRKASKLHLLFNFKILFTQPEDSDTHKGLASINDFRINSQDINVGQKDFNQLKSVYKEIHRRSKQSLM